MKRNLTLTLLLALFLLPWQPARPQGSTRYQVAVCDWMMLKRQKAGALTLARAIGADGVEVDMGPLGRRELFDNQLRDKQAASRFRGMADSLGVKVPSMAMSVGTSVCFSGPGEKSVLVCFSITPPPRSLIDPSPGIASPCSTSSA